MLKKKGFAMMDDWTEFGTSLVLIAVIVLILIAFNVISKFSIGAILDTVLPNNDEISAYDTEFLETDLINVLKVQVNEDYTFGEILSYMDRNHPDPQDDFLFKDFLSLAFTKSLNCDDNLKSKLSENLEPISGFWEIYLLNENNEYVFFCSGIDTLEATVYAFTAATNPYLLSQPQSAEIFIPDVDGNRKLKVVLEVKE
ncbi:hypothetical protein HON03_01655 [archaeon]|jgi:hypothetical protein|nr:hypothetical protein [archaeon]MBT5288522.1 hypothetical protein [archaeon]